MKTRTVAALFVAALALLLWLFRAPQPTGDITTAIFGTADVRAAFASAERVTVQRLHQHDPSQYPRKLEDYTHDAPVSVPGDTVQRLRKLFQQTGSFAWNISKSCAPDYGVLFTFHSPQ